MTHLYIELNTGLTEEVNSSIISKLYELAISGDLDNTSDLKGRLHTTICKDTHYNYLNNNFDELYISADTLSITFEDSFVEYWAAYYIGDGTNVLLSDILAFITSGKFFGDGYSNPHTGHQHRWIQYYTDFIQIVSFDELSLFEGITGIFHKAFENCINMTSIQLPTTVTTIGRLAFKSTLKLTSIDLSNVKYIYQDAFRGSGITGIVNLPEIVNFVGTSDNTFTGSGDQFQGCTKITEVNLGPNLLHIETNNIFGDCSNLETITGLSNITTVPRLFVKNCSKLTSLDIDWSKITTIKESSFEGCTIMPFGELSIPNLVNIESGAFKSCLGLTKLTGLNNITSVPGATFSGCSNLTTVDIDWSKITSIDQSAFYGCSSLPLTNLSIPNLTSLGIDAFRGSKIISISDLGSITELPQRCFQNTSSLVSVTLPNTITKIWYSAFADSSISTINIPSSVTSLYKECFYRCSNLNGTFDLSNVTLVESLAFTNCNNVTISSFPRATTYPVYCFLGIKNTSITIPKEVVTIADGALQSCANLETVSFEANSNLTTIGISAFSNSPRLTSISYPEGVTTLERDTVSSSASLLSIELPSTVTTINGRLVLYNDSLQSITCKATTPPQASSALFSAINSTCVIYVPASSVSAYQSATGWSSVASRIQAIPT